MYSITVAGYSVYFPHEPYSIQKAYMGRLLYCLKNTKNGLLESPTGTGKTLSILCSAMAWLDVENEKALDVKENQDDDTPLSERQVPDERTRVIYASRTHVQLSQAMKELKNSEYASKSAIILGSRDQLCVNMDVTRLEGNAAKTHACRSKVRTGACAYHSGYEAKVSAEYETLEVVDIEDLVTKGVSKKFCPYYASRLLKQKADVIFSPYNYLLDPTLRRNQGIDLRNTVIIFDEGHNIEQNCEDSASCQLRSTSLDVCIKEIENQVNRSNNPVYETTFKKGEVFTSDDLKNPIREKKTDDELMDLSPIDLLFVKKSLTGLQSEIEDQLATSKTVENNRVSTDWIFDTFKKLKFTNEKVEQILGVLDKMSLFLGGTASHSANRMKIASIESLAAFFRTVFPPDLPTGKFNEFRNEFCQKFAIALKEDEGSNNKFKEDRSYPFTVVRESKTKAWIMDLYCLSPSVAMKQLKQLGVKCIIITSGTLSPLDSFESEMELPFPVKLENRHVIDERQLLVCAVAGRANCQFDSRFCNRDNKEYFKSLGEALIEYSRIIPDGVLVFFSSYPVMRKATEIWESMGQYDRLGSLKLCFKEPQDKSSFSECLDKFKYQIDSSTRKGAIFFGVCRGKLSEGLDIGNRYCRAVIMIGIPFPSFYDNKSVFKREYVRKKGDPNFTADMYYNIQMKRSLNQAIGRVIRHKEDFGAVVLLDYRFSNHQDSLSKWIRPFFKTCKWEDSKKNLENFFVENSKPKNVPTKRVAIQITASPKRQKFL